MSGSFARATPHAPHRPPPDYTSRHVKLRLFITLASIMLVAALVERTLNRSKPQITLPNEPFNNRLHTEHRTSHDPAGTFVAVSDSKPDTAPAREQPVDPVDRAVSQGWKDIFTRLSADDRDLLFELLYAERHDRPLPPEKMALTADLLPRLAKFWSEYQAAALGSLSDVNEADKPKWNEVLQQADNRFDEGLTLLKTLADGRQVAENDRSSLVRVESTLVAIARNQIQDDTPILRPAERQAWLYEFAKVANVLADQAFHDKAARVGYLQLSRQPADYRGKFVTIKGNVRRAYRSAASPNYLDIKDYCVYWLYPAGGPDTPIVVYALDAPAGFPKLAKNLQATNKYREDVEITGIFFKRCAYAAQGGTYTAPLILANTPVWHPAPPPFSAAPSPNLIYEVGGAALVTLVVALCITSVLWKRSSTRRSRAQSLSDTSLVDLSNVSTSPTATDHLRQLETREGGST